MALEGGQAVCPLVHDFQGWYIDWYHKTLVLLTPKDKDSDECFSGCWYRRRVRLPPGTEHHSWRCPKLTWKSCQTWTSESRCFKIRPINFVNKTLKFWKSAAGISVKCSFPYVFLCAKLSDWFGFCVLQKLYCVFMVQQLISVWCACRIFGWSLLRLLRRQQLWVDLSLRGPSVGDHQQQLWGHPPCWPPGGPHQWYSNLIRMTQYLATPCFALLKTVKDEARMKTRCHLMKETHLVHVKCVFSVPPMCLHFKLWYVRFIHFRFSAFPEPDPLQHQSARHCHQKEPWNILCTGVRSFQTRVHC